MPPRPLAPIPPAQTPASAAVPIPIRLPPIWSELNPSSRQQLAQLLARLMRRRLDPLPPEEKRGANECC